MRHSRLCEFTLFSQLENERGKVKEGCEYISLSN